MLKKIRRISYDSATFEGHGFVAHYSTDTGIELRIRSELDGAEPDAFDKVDTERYAKVWGLASFGHVFASLLPIQVEVRALSFEPHEEERWRSWFIGTLSEHFYRSGIAPELDLTFSGEQLAPRESASNLAERAILMSGGGKDSVVCAELLKALDVPFLWFSSDRRMRKDPAVRKIAKIAGGQPLIMSAVFSEVKSRRDHSFKRAKPARLLRHYRRHRRQYRRCEWLSLMGATVEGCLLAEATASRFVLIGNERSANEGNGVFVGDLEVNHQYGKSYGFEREFAPFLVKYLHPEIRHSSLLMPFYELQLAKIFAACPQYFSAFKSCNRRTAERPWCLKCPKCAFVYLLMSAFVEEETVVQVFQRDLLTDPGVAKIFMDLCGRGAYKPLECVGLAEESLLAMHLASKRRKRSPIHPELVAILPGPDRVDELWREILHAYNAENGLPEHWNQALRKVI